MEKNHAYRNIDLCTKDCVCLYVCPTGATNNETGQIDFSKCIGCGACALACPSRAILMIPNTLPIQQKKDKEMINKLLKIADNKINEIKILQSILELEDCKDKRIFKALINSNKIMLEDIMRESGYMIPQSKSTKLLLNKISNDNSINESKIAQKLLNIIKFNE